MHSNFLCTKPIEIAKQFISMVGIYLSIFKHQRDVQCEVIHPLGGLPEFQANTVMFTDVRAKLFVAIRVHFMH